VLQDFHFVKKTDAASPTLFLSCLKGEHIKQATITAPKAGKEQQGYVKIQLTDILAISFEQKADVVPDTPLDSFSMSVANIVFNALSQGRDGSVETSGTS
jgi:type VI secretion system secreted protein Hcp